MFIKRKINKELCSWSLLDWANSAWPTVIITFIFSTYFVKNVAPNEIIGTSLWGYMLSISGLALAFLAPIIGIYSDIIKRRKVFLIISSCLTCLFAFLLWFADTNKNIILFILIIIGLGNIFFEISTVFYNALLKKVSDKNNIGKISGIAWSLGYIGGIVSLIICFLLFINPEKPVFGLDKEKFEHVRIIGPFIGLWFLIFSIPSFIFIKEKKIKIKRINLIANIKKTFLSIENTTLKFLISRMLYTDGLNTLFAFGGIYAATLYNMEFSEIILFGIALNISAGFGSVIFAFFDDKFGPRIIIKTCLISLISICSFILITNNKILFWILGIGIGLFIGGLQSTSRSCMARLSKINDQSKMFGIYGLSGKITAFLGPYFVALLTTTFNNQKAGFVSIIIFFILGYLIIKDLKLPN
ncbi:MAG: hypothetical protein CFH25_00431 [Alphaproteobacteria bacterium MarineAlpha6_Bin3]|nr:MAG: hypothetical protein CFH25_00431 [Alphaproteobacteria bacterium MarineAlpha6_Bin3]